MQGNASVDDYVAALPDVARAALTEIRRRIRWVLPGVEEVISYQVPTFVVAGRRVLHVAAWKAHIGVYPAPGGDTEFEQAMAPYRSGVATLKFPLAEPMPYDLIERIAKAAFSRSAVSAPKGRPARSTTSGRTRPRSG